MPWPNSKICKASHCIPRSTYRRNKILPDRSSRPIPCLPLGYTRKLLRSPSKFRFCFWMFHWLRSSLPPASYTTPNCPQRSTFCDEPLVGEWPPDFFAACSEMKLAVCHSRLQNVTNTGVPSEAMLHPCNSKTGRGLSEGSGLALVAVGGGDNPFPMATGLLTFSLQQRMQTI